MTAQSEQVEGTLELDGDRGFLRSPKGNYSPTPRDAMVPADLVRRFCLRGGETIRGAIAAPRGKKRPRRELGRIDTINELEPDDYAELIPLTELTPVDPHEPLRFEKPDGPLSMRVVDLMTPIGRGQRGLIVAPPRTGKTVLLKHMADGVATNYPDVYILVLLVDERPEEVTEMRRGIKGEVVASSNDRDAASHVRLARLMIARAKRMVECGRHVFVLLDSLTRLGRAFNTFCQGSGRIMSGGLDARALNEPKSIFGAARNIEHGGSLTIMATALIDTGSRMDEVIFNEFKGTGNMEIVLCRELANKRIWPAIDLAASGTRKEELLLTPDLLTASHRVRRELGRRSLEMDMQNLLEALERHSTNEVYATAAQR